MRGDVSTAFVLRPGGKCLVSSTVTVRIDWNGCTVGLSVAINRTLEYRFPRAHSRQQSAIYPVTELA